MLRKGPTFHCIKLYYFVLFCIILNYFVFRISDFWFFRRVQIRVLAKCRFSYKNPAQTQNSLDEMSMEKSRFLRAHGHGHGHGHGRASGGKGRYGERRGGAKRIALGLKTRERPQMMVMMACVAFRALQNEERRGDCGP